MFAARLRLSQPGRALQARVTIIKHARPQVIRRVAAAAAAADEAVDDTFVYGESESPSTSTEIPDAAPSVEFPAPTYHLNVLFLENCIGIAVDQKLASGEVAPVTEYYMWPAKDAWDMLKTSLEDMPWITQTESIHLLNSATQVINFWQDEEVKHTLDEAVAEFPDIKFLGS